MTRFLVRIADAAEAALASAGGADLVEYAPPVFGDAEAIALRAIRASFPGTVRLAPAGPATPDVVAAAVAAGVDELAFEGSPPTRDTASGKGIALVARVPAGPGASVEGVARLHHAVDRVSLESGSAARLLDRAGIARLAAHAEACRAADLPYGFAGGLEAPDIPRLLMLRPDTLGFDEALRTDRAAHGTLLPQRIEAIRALIPRAGGGGAASEGGVRDTIVVRDFVVAMSIGAYHAEEAARQRVRFGVEAVVVRRAGPPRDMRDVFSYDVILETIRVLAERPHVAFVETLAEEVAATLLVHDGIESVTVQVEKLDIVDGAVGVRLVRARPPA